MRSDIAESGTRPGGQSHDFSLVLGGPLFQILRRSHLSGSALELLRRRLVLFPLICWLPLAAFSLLQGDLSEGALPFVSALEAHVRFLIVVPLLIAAEVTVFRRTRFIVSQFVARDLVANADMRRFEAAIESATRLRNSVVIEVLMIAVICLADFLVIGSQFTAFSMASWYAHPSGDTWSLTAAGIWFSVVSLPVFQFLLLRWYYRIFIWWRFLWQVSRIPLRLVPTHPDGAGGLSFLAGSVYAFSPLLFAHGSMLAGVLAGRIFHTGAVLTDFKLEILAMIALLLCLVYGPLMVFSASLWRAKELGKREYGVLAQDYVRGFDAKWLRGGAPADEELLGSADIGSLADLSTSYELVKSMQTTLVSKEGLIFLAWASFAPVLPLALTMMPLDELLTRLFGLFF